MKIEIRSDSVHISGYVNAVGRDSRKLRSPSGEFVEMIEPGTFRAALEKSDNVELLLNHEKKLGGLREGNLILKEDNIGLHAEADITVPEVIESARKGELRGWSFGMFVIKDYFEERSEQIPRRHIQNMDLFEVSIINDRMIPCYAGTSLECRADKEVFSETRAGEDEDHEIIDNSALLPDYSEWESRIAARRTEAELSEWEERAAALGCKFG